MTTVATTAKTVIDTRSAPGRHWVGDGFPVHGMFGYNGADVPSRSPFLMLDYAAPTEFPPNSGYRRGVGQHPHRGFETVTIVYEGEVEHRDSTGAGGVIGRGDVQWMTAGAGIIHEEFHSERYSREGGPFEMVQLWVNLPKKDKMTPAHYQGITDAQIPSIALPGDAGRVRVIAGRYGEGKGPAETYSPMNVWDMRLKAGQSADLAQPEGWSTLIVVLDGTVLVNGEKVLRKAEMATLSHEGSGVTIEANADTKVLLLAGEPIDEPVVGYGPFVMNSQAEIAEAIRDFNSGKFGRMA
ncbi:quercetin 2,3-dioxygenase [Vandammella animalimorsus]|uniref:Quercetin 2,3-dioxygenase n=1 Tax=Vandammella animalimorsus TaxID=2029117 RepID=A0A2A2T876_9BURK|nr:pirin family protein [Vandammella animalimorsus]PAT32848.1 quercetin 2,3-dioxygenase [Vandammella animalimorsus]PAX18014.1 quercetin 2,3-dioxygenase [Vandammella animalimorsus]PAX20168.1 quercetin 2,3-dioxygenase [Vandammella animalimorsus]